MCMYLRKLTYIGVSRKVSLTFKLRFQTQRRDSKLNDMNAEEICRERDRESIACMNDLRRKESWCYSKPEHPVGMKQSDDAR